VKTYYLESHSPASFNEKTAVPGLKIDEHTDKDFKLNKRLYELVGNQWRWNDKLGWSDRHWQEYAEAQDLRTWVAYFEGTLAGYFELQKQAGEQVEIAYFGLLPEFIGRGLGGDLLSRAIKAAWRMGAARVWVHTCTLDHPGALANYQARGMQVYKTETS